MGDQPKPTTAILQTPLGPVRVQVRRHGDRATVKPEPAATPNESGDSGIPPRVFVKKEVEGG